MSFQSFKLLTSTEGKKMSHIVDYHVSSGNKFLNEEFFWNQNPLIKNPFMFQVSTLHTCQNLNDTRVIKSR